MYRKYVVKPYGRLRHWSSIKIPFGRHMVVGRPSGCHLVAGRAFSRPFGRHLVVGRPFGRPFGCWPSIWSSI